MANASRKYKIYSPLEYLWSMQAGSLEHTHLWNTVFMANSQCKQKVQNLLTFGIFMVHASKKYRIFSPLEYL
jgi:hypothetical protein